MRCINKVFAKICNFFTDFVKKDKKNVKKEVKMTAFVWDVAINTTLKFEGGYVNDLRDSGGETNFGISKKAYPNLDIKALSIDDAKKIYKRDYWDRCKCNFIPDALSIALFDFAVNSGCNRAIRYLQRALGITIDGKIGNQTIGACNSIPVKETLEKFIIYRLEYLMSLKAWKYYGNGWGARVKSIQSICEKYL